MTLHARCSVLTSDCQPQSTACPCPPTAFQAPLFWGSDLKAAVSAVLKVGKFGLIEVPVEIANVQVHRLSCRLAG